MTRSWATRVETEIKRQDRIRRHAPQCVARKESGLGGCWCKALGPERVAELWAERDSLR